MDLDAIVARVRRSYGGGASAYSDHGTVTSHLPQIGTATADFEDTLRAVRPIFFSFREQMIFQEETTKTWRRAFRIERDGAFLRLGDPEWRKGRPESLAIAIACCTGVSWGAAHVVPRLLMPDEVTGRMLFDGEQRALVEEEELDGEQHLVVELGDHATSNRVWIHPRSARVRRVTWLSEGRVQVTDYFARLVAAVVS